MEAKSIIDNYFGKAEHSATITMMGNIAIIDITYKDFKPERIVRRELEDMIPMADITISERQYSPQAVERAVKELLNTDCIIKFDDREIPIFTYVNEQLFLRDLTL